MQTAFLYVSRGMVRHRPGTNSYKEYSMARADQAVIDQASAAPAPAAPAQETPTVNTEDRRNRLCVRSALQQARDKGWPTALAEEDERHGGDGWILVADGNKTHDVYRTPGVSLALQQQRVVEVDGPDATHPLQPPQSEVV
jgi:hypothetical protein